MTRKLKIALLTFGLILLIAVVLWYPYESGIVPEWKLQIVDSSGRLIADAQANQEWLNSIDDGIISSDSRNTDSNGVVVFLRRVLRNRLALGVPRSGSSARIFVCWQDQYGDVFLDETHRQLSIRLVLQKGSCPYG